MPAPKPRSKATPITVTVKSGLASLGIKGPPPPPPPFKQPATITLTVAGLKLVVTVPGDSALPVEIVPSGRRRVAFKGAGIKGPPPPPPPFRKKVAKKAVKKGGGRSAPKLIKGPVPVQTDH